MNYVYAVLNLRTRHVKIGRASNPERRLKQLQTGSAHRLRLIGAVSEYETERNFGVTDAKGFLEHMLHLACAKERVTGEWFRKSPLLDEACAAIQAGPNEVLWFITEHIPIARIGEAVALWKMGRQC